MPRFVWFYKKYRQPDDLTKRTSIIAKFLLDVFPNRSDQCHDRNKRPKESSKLATFTIDTENNITVHAGLHPADAAESRSFSNQKELAKLTADWPASR